MNFLPHLVHFFIASVANKNLVREVTGVVDRHAVLVELIKVAWFTAFFAEESVVAEPNADEVVVF
jgi:hypothetical protein